LFATVMSLMESPADKGEEAPAAEPAEEAEPQPEEAKA
jgi:hypothetical protein